MFDRIYIKGFRGIREAAIGDMKQVNVFFGKNNCGKSSLLESLFLISGLSNPKLPFNINILRDYKKLSKKDIALDFYNLNIAEPIHIVAENQEVRDLKIKLFETSDTDVNLLGKDNNISSTQPEYNYGLALEYSVDGISHRSNIIFTPTSSSVARQEISIDNNYVEKLRCKYLNSKFDFQTSVSGLANILKNKDEQFLVEALRYIEPRLNDIVLSESDILVDVGLSQRIPINMMGDGARKLLSLLTCIYECEDGVVLFDEISNGFHYSVMKDVWLAIIQASKKNNVQVFATTHDMDSIRGLRDATLELAPEDASNISAYKLQKKVDGNLVAYHYSYKSLDYSINQDIEIR